jgi:ankyrin repeat protein
MMHVRELANFAQVSRRFYQIMQECLWRKAEHRRFWLPMFLGAAEGNIPLMEEAMRRGCPVGKVWLSSKLGIRYGFKNGQTPLHLAVVNGHADAVDWLLVQGASTAVNHPGWLDEDLSLLLLAVNKAWSKTRHCEALSEEQLETLGREWHVPTGPRYRIFCALLRAGARLPPDTRQKQEWHYLMDARECCRIVAAPTLQQLLQHGANIHAFCHCDLPPWPPQWGELDDEDYTEWFWRAEKYPGECHHDGDFLPFSKSDRERIWATMCDTLKAVDREGVRLFAPDDEIVQQPDE